MRKDYVIPDETSGKILGHLICISVSDAGLPVSKNAIHIDVGKSTAGMMVDIPTGQIKEIPKKGIISKFFKRV